MLLRPLEVREVLRGVCKGLNKCYEIVHEQLNRKTETITNMTQLYLDNSKSIIHMLTLFAIDNSQEIKS